MPRARSLIGSTLIAAALAAGGADVAAAPAPASSPEASTAVAQPRRPAAVREWLGRWQTGSGALTVYDAVYIPAVKFRTGCPCVWSLIGRWEHPDGSKPLVRGVLSRDNAVLSAGYPLADGRSGSIRAARKGRTFRGFWKPCRTFCKTTKWTGRKTVDLRVYRVGFRFTQNGRPREHTSISTRSGGAGAAVFLAAPDDNATGLPGAGVKAFHIDLIPDGVDLRLTLEAVGPLVYNEERGGRDVLVMGLEVTETSDPKCRTGERAMLTLTDGHGRGVDRVGLSFDEDSKCAHDETWLSTDPARVNVVIGPVKRG